MVQATALRLLLLQLILLLPVNLQLYLMRLHRLLLNILWQRWQLPTHLFLRKYHLAELRLRLHHSAPHRSAVWR